PRRLPGPRRTVPRRPRLTRPGLTGPRLLTGRRLTGHRHVPVRRGGSGVGRRHPLRRLLRLRRRAGGGRFVGVSVRCRFGLLCAPIILRRTYGRAVVFRHHLTPCRPRIDVSFLPQRWRARPVVSISDPDGETRPFTPSSPEYTCIRPPSQRDLGRSVKWVDP